MKNIFLKFVGIKKTLRGSIDFFIIQAPNGDSKFPLGTTITSRTIQKTCPEQYEFIITNLDDWIASPKN